MEQSHVLEQRGLDRVSPYFIPSVLVDSASGQIAISLGMRGPNYAPVSACATGSHAVGEGAEIIRRGDADVILAGGTEACMHPLILAGFCAMRGLAAEEEHPPRASRPFDATRAGFVMGEGACVLALEDLDAAANGAQRCTPRCSGTAPRTTRTTWLRPIPLSVGVAEMMRAALARARVDPTEVDYVNAHGTSTPLGDLAETKALKDVFGDHAYELAVSSTKSMMGHCFGAAGAIEAMMCVLAIHEGTIPPTINYEHPDPECDLDYVPNEARQAKVDVALSNAMGLGGHNGCVLLGRVEPVASATAWPSSSTSRSRSTRQSTRRELLELFERLAEETREKTTAPQMMVGRIEGGFLAALVGLTGAKRILELGTFTGYSSISMATALPDDGRIITCDVDPDATSIARRYMDESGHGDKIEIRLGPALETIETPGRAVRPRLHRRRQAELPELLRGRSAEGRRQRAADRRQRPLVGAGGRGGRGRVDSGDQVVQRARQERRPRRVGDAHRPRRDDARPKALADASRSRDSRLTRIENSPAKL